MLRQFRTIAVFLLLFALQVFTASGQPSVGADSQTGSLLRPSDEGRTGTVFSHDSLSSSNLREKNVHSLKDLSVVVPNLFVVNYGSRQTMAMSMRGVGGDVFQHAVGVSVDGIPMLGEGTLDFLLDDVESVEVLRGPQSVLYGRNVIGGLLRVNTRSPFDYSGTVMERGMATKGCYNSQVTHYRQLSDRLAFSAGTSYWSNGSCYSNKLTGLSADDDFDWRTHFRLQSRTLKHFDFDFQTSYELSAQTPYPYFLESVPGNDAFLDVVKDDVGAICNDYEHSYRHHLFNASVSLQRQLGRVTLRNKSGYQFVKHNMQFDQDFTRADIAKSIQRRKVNSFSEELTVESNPMAWSHWHWVTGASVNYQRYNSFCPSTFSFEGMRWMSGMGGAETSMSSALHKIESLGIASDATCQEESRQTVGNYAVFHQSTLSDFLSLKDLDITVGLRLDYENRRCDYSTEWNGANGGKVKLGERQQASLNDDDLFLLPKITMQYRYKRGNVFGTVARGYRSGGYNWQYFCLDGEGENPASHRSYKPESAWNYEAGTHVDFLNDRLSAEASLFMTNSSNVQLARPVNYDFGRMIVNVGDSRTLGGEFSLSAKLLKSLTIRGCYGFAHATFRDAQAADNTSLRGRFVPYVPRHTINLGASYSKDVNILNLVDRLVFSADWRGVGETCWTEDNSVKEPFYNTLDLKMTVYVMGRIEFGAFATNVFNKDYRVYYYQNMGRGFCQYGRPFRIGFETKARF